MNAEIEGRSLAHRFRQEHHLGHQAIGDLVAVIEQATGIDVAILDVDTNEHGLTMRDPVYDAVFIGIARTRNPMRQRSTLAHELGHVLFKEKTDASHGGSWSARTPAEIRADAFARNLLVPIEGLKEFLAKREMMTQSMLSAVVQRFLVSPQIAAIALNQAKYINDDTKLEWMALTAPQLATRFGWSDQYRILQTDSAQRRTPQRLLARAIRGYEEGVLSTQAIATLRGITLEAAEADLRQAGVIPVQRSIPWSESAQLPDVYVDITALDEVLNTPDGDGRGCTTNEDEAE